MLLLSITSILLFTAVLALYAVRVAKKGRATHERLGPSPGSALFPGWLVEGAYWALSAPGRALANLGVEPDVLTYLALACSLVSLPLAATGRLVPAALCILAGGALDALDGMVARARGAASAAGALLDSFVDRLSDAAPFVGLAIFYRDRVATLVVPLGALVASSLVSYARARADAHGLTLPNGLMRRHERIAYLVAALLLAPVLPRAELAGAVLFYPVTLAGVALIAAVGFVASIVLVSRARAALSEAKPRTIARAAQPAR